MSALGDCPQTARTMIDRVHRRDDRQKNLRRANVTGGFVAANVLLARLQRKAISRSAFGIVRNSDQASRHMPFVLVAGGKERGVRPTESERYSESLGVSNGDISSKFPRRF